MATKVMHIGKCKLSQVGGMRNHMEHRDRVKTNENIDLDRSKYNYSIDGRTAENLEARVRQRIKDAGVKRKIRPDAVGLEDIIIGANHDWMQDATKETRDAYFKDAFDFFANRFGIDNVMYADVHLDESNIHMHLGLVPIVFDEKGNARLSAREFIKKSDFGKLHDDFAREVSSKYGLERGGKNAADGYPKKYPDMNEYKAQKEEQIRAGIKAVEELKKFHQTGGYGTKNFGLSEDREYVRIPTESYKAIYEAAKLNAEAASMTADELVKREAAETRAKVLEEERTRLEGELERERGNLREVMEDTRTYRDAPADMKEQFERARCQELVYQQNVQRGCVAAFLRNKRNLSATVREMSEVLEGIGVCGKKEQTQYVKKCLSECRKQLKDACPRNKKTGRIAPRPDYERPKTSGSMQGGGRVGGGAPSSWQSPPASCNFLARLSDPGFVVGVPGRLGDRDWDELTPEEKEEKLFWRDMFA